MFRPDYLELRCINVDVARKYLSQITFKAPGGVGKYFSLGYPAGTGFETRNAQFKGFIGTGKDITVHPGIFTEPCSEGCSGRF